MLTQASGKAQRSSGRSPVGKILQRQSARARAGVNRLARAFHSLAAGIRSGIAPPADAASCFVPKRRFAHAARPSR